VFLYGFAKNEEENIDRDKLIELRIVGSNWLNAAARTIAIALEEGVLQEVNLDEQEET